MKCSCGRDVKTVEIRVIQRCELGHFVSSEIAPAVLKEGVPEKATPGQIRAFHAKCSRVDEIRGEKVGSTKRRMLDQLGHESASLLTSAQATKVLDDLEFQIDTLAA